MSDTASDTVLRAELMYLVERYGRQAVYYAVMAVLRRQELVDAARGVLVPYEAGDVQTEGREN